MRSICKALATLIAAGCSPSAYAPGSPAGTTGSAPPPLGFDAQLSVSSLAFASVGDTRPAETCRSLSACGYPSELIGRIYQQIAALAQPVPFVVSTGDYQYNSPGDGTARWQLLQQYLPAAQQFRGSIFPALGNHECNGFTDSNCIPGGPLPCDAHDACGVTENLAAFNALLGSLGLPGAFPYYAVRVSIAGGRSAKLVVTAPNAWDPRQASWLASVLSQPTTYTFVVQHEPNDLDEAGASAPASLGAIRSLVQSSGRAVAAEAYPVTLWIVGHIHNFDYDPAHQQVINGLGGAPTDGIADGEDPAHFYRSNDGAYLLCREQSGGDPPALQCSLYDSQTQEIIGGGTSFAVHADGTPAEVE